MIISHRHKFIHIKALKVAGSSVECALLPHLGPEDVIHPIEDFNPDIDETEYQWKSQHVEGRVDAHMTPKKMKKLYPKEWSEYTKIAEIRNPWDKLLSFWFWGMRGKMDIKMPRVFHQFIGWHCHPKTAVPPIDNDRYFLGGRCCIDHLLRFEHLEHDVEILFNSLGIPFEGLPRLKTKRKKAYRYHYSAYYTNEMIEKVEQKYQAQIAMTGYKFDDQRPPHLRR